MMTIPDIFDRLGGPSKVARLLNIKSTTANEMKRRKIIPVWYWPRLKQICKENRVYGVNYTMLVELHQRGESSQ
jgi:hypothetical protein